MEGITDEQKKEIIKEHYSKMGKKKKMSSEEARELANKRWKKLSTSNKK